MAAVVLFSIGFVTLFLHPNLIKKIIGMNLMDTAVFLFLAAMGYVDGGKAPMVERERRRRPTSTRCPRAGAHGHRGGGEHHGPVSGPHPPPVPEVPQFESGRDSHAGPGGRGEERSLKPAARREGGKPLSLSYNIRFLSILLAMVSAILVPLLRNGRWALNLVRGVQLAAAAASAYLLAELSLL